MLTEVLGNQNTFIHLGNVLVLRNAFRGGGLDLMTDLMNLTLQKAFVGFCITREVKKPEFSIT
jgi:hypothetical protein